MHSSKPRPTHFEAINLTRDTDLYLLVVIRSTRPVCLWWECEKALKFWHSLAEIEALEKAVLEKDAVVIVAANVRSNLELADEAEKRRGDPSYTTEVHQELHRQLERLASDLRAFVDQLELGEESRLAERLRP